MDVEKMQSDYIERVNNEIVSIINFTELNNSYISEGNKYGRCILKKLHDIFVSIYRTDCLDKSYEVVCVPSIIKPYKSEIYMIGITMLDTEIIQRYGTAFFTSNGVLDELDDYISEEEREYMQKELLPYNCWYTVYPNKNYIQVINKAPKIVKEIIRYCRNEK